MGKTSTLEEDGSARSKWWVIFLLWLFIKHWTCLGNPPLSKEWKAGLKNHNGGKSHVGWCEGVRRGRCPKGFPAARLGRWELPPPVLALQWVCYNFCCKCDMHRELFYCHPQDVTIGRRTFVFKGLLSSAFTKTLVQSWSYYFRSR